MYRIATKVDPDSTSTYIYNYNSSSDAEFTITLPSSHKYFHPSFYYCKIYDVWQSTANIPGFSLDSY